MFQRGGYAMGFASLYPSYELSPTHSVIARSEATKQSRLPPRRDSGLLRSARNDDVEAALRQTPLSCPGSAQQRSRAAARPGRERLQIPRQFGLELAVHRVLDLAAVDADVAQGAV